MKIAVTTTTKTGTKNVKMKMIVTGKMKKMKKTGRMKRIGKMTKTGDVEDSGKNKRRSSKTVSLKEPGNAGSTAKKRCSLSTATGEIFRMVAKNGREIPTYQRASLIA